MVSQNVMIGIGAAVVILITVIVIFSLPVKGCMDKIAFNYNPNATKDDGSCIPVIKGCMVKESKYYNSEANTPDECGPPCEKGEARTFNPTSGIYDGLCSEIVEGCLEETACNFAGNASGVNVHRQELCDLPNYHIGNDCNGPCKSGETGYCVNQNLI